MVSPRKDVGDRVGVGRREDVGVGGNAAPSG